MSLHCLRLGACLAALALTLSVSSSSVLLEEDIRSAAQRSERPAAASGTLMMESVPAMLPEPDPQPVLTQEDVDQALAEVMEDFTAAAVSVATVERGQLSQSGAWGWAVKDEREMTPDTKMRVASLSKVVVAMCAMAMEEEGLLDLDAPLSDYWGPGVRNPYSKGQPSARTLMTHTSSLRDLETTRGLSRLQSLLRSAYSWRSMEPGSWGYWYYSNFGVCVLGTTLELACNGLLEDYLQAHILQPLGVDASFFAETLAPEQLAALYTTGGVGRSLAEQIAPSTPTQIGQSASYFPGGFTASAVDMAKLAAVLANDGVYKTPIYSYVETASDEEQSLVRVVLRMMEPQYIQTRILSEASVEAMETPYFTVDPVTSTPFEQCLILRRQEDILGQDVLYYHTGSAYGVFTLMTYNPDTQNGVVVLTTGAPRSTDERGLYSLCASLSGKLYEKMDRGGPNQPAA